MAKLSAEAKVGLLVIAGAVILLYMTFAVGKYQFGERKGYLLQATFDSVAGLDVKASVRMAGVKIGDVEKVELSDSRAKVTMRIDQDVHIPRGTEAMIKTLGLLGEKYVEFVPVRNRPLERAARGEASFYGPDEQVQVTVSPSDVDQLINQLSAISSDVKQITGSLRQVLGTQQGERTMEDMLNDLRKTTENIKEFSFTLKNDGGELVTRLNELVASLNGVVNDNRDNLRVTLENAREASKKADLALTSIQDTAQKIDSGSGTLGKLVNSDSMYTNIDNAAKGLDDYVTRIERMKTIVGFRSEYMFPQSKSYATLEIKPRPDTYYILEVTSDPFGSFTYQQTTETPPGGTVTTETYQNTFKFSIEFAKRWGNLALRLGLIESTGGAGVDYFAFDDRVKFSLDSWNYNSQEPGNLNPHLKATASYSINKNLFVDAGFDNFLNPQRKAALVGVGLLFDDEDLKYLLGSVPIK